MSKCFCCNRASSTGAPVAGFVYHCKQHEASATLEARRRYQLLDLELRRKGAVDEAERLQPQIETYRNEIALLKSYNAELDYDFKELKAENANLKDEIIELHRKYISLLEKHMNA